MRPAYISFQMCASKDTIHRVKRHPIGWEKIFGNHMSDKELISKKHRELLKLNNKKINNLIQKWAKDLNGHFS